MVFSLAHLKVIQTTNTIRQVTLTNQQIYTYSYFLEQISS